MQLYDIRLDESDEEKEEVSGNVIIHNEAENRSLFCIVVSVVGVFLTYTIYNVINKSIEHI